MRSSALDGDLDEQTSRSIWYRPHLALIAAVYLLAWWPMLLNGGRYWDDWVMVRFSFHGASLMADQIGQLWQRYYWMALSWWPAAGYIFHFVTFALLLGAAMLVYALLRRLPGVSPTVALLVAAVFAVFPVNAARFVQVNLQYTVSIATFYLGWYLLAVDLDRPHVGRKIAAAALLVVAMITTNSLLVFAALIPAYLLWARRAELRDPRARMTLLVRYGFVLLLPIAVYAFRSVALQPWGLYASYNALSKASLLASPKLLFPAVRESLLKPLVQPLLGRPWWLLLAVPAFVLLRRYAREEQESSSKQYLLLAAAGAAAFFLAVFPYIAVGKLPQATGFGWDLWDSRHQVLVPLGAALLLCGALLYVARVARVKQVVVAAVMAALIGGFVIADLKTSLAYQADWYKQASLMAHMADSADFREGNYFIVTDDAVQLNVVGRRYLPYEFSGMMYLVFGDATRFGIDAELLPVYAPQLEAFKKYEQYHWRDWQPPARTYQVRLLPGDVDLTDRRTLLSLMWQERFDRDRFEQRLYDVLDVQSRAEAGQ